MGRSVSYPSAASVITFNSPEYDCACRDNRPETGRVLCDCSDPTSALSVEDRAECGDCDGLGTVKCPDCEGYGKRSMDGDDFDELIDDFRSHLAFLFPSVEPADDWIGNEDHVLAENRLARFGMSEYCGLVAYWIVPNKPRFGYNDDQVWSEAFADRWIASIKDKFVAAFGELTKVGSMSNGEGVYRRIDK